MPFQALSSAKSSDNTNVPKKKKRKVASPLVEFKSSKLSKLSKDCHDPIVPKTKAESDAREKSDSKDCIVITEENNLEQNSLQDENKKINVTHKRGSLGKTKKLEKTQQKSGALTKFLKKTDEKSKSVVGDKDDDMHKSQAREDVSDVTMEEEEEEEEKEKEKEKEENADNTVSSELQSSSKATSQQSQANRELTNSSNVHDSDMKSSSFPQSDSDAILSSDNEIHELNESILSRNEETEQVGVTCVTPKSEKNANKAKDLKRLTPKQLEKRREIARKREEKLKLRMVRWKIIGNCYV